MDTGTLIRNFIDTYGLVDSPSVVASLRNKLKLAGFGPTIDNIPLAIDILLDTSIPRGRTASSGGFIKTASILTANSCPRCNTPMNPVKLANDHNASHCSSCNVVIPS